MTYPIFFALVVSLTASEPDGPEASPEAARSPTPTESVAAEAMRRAVDRGAIEWMRSIDLYEDHRDWDRAWEVESKHYRVRTTHSHLMAAALCDDLEAMFNHFQQILGTNYEPPSRFPIFILPSLEAYNKFGDDHGEEHSSFYGAFHSSSHPQGAVACMYVRNYMFLRMFVTHAATHQFLRAAFPTQVPLWLEEGLAAYFSLYWNYEHGIQQVGAMQASQRLFTINQLVRASASDYADRTDDRMWQLAMLFSWLMWTQQETRSTRFENGEVEPGRFQHYIRDLLSGKLANRLEFHEWWLNEHREELEKQFAEHDFRS